MVESKKHKSAGASGVVACPNCRSLDTILAGKSALGVDRYECNTCGKMFTPGASPAPSPPTPIAASPSSIACPLCSSTNVQSSPRKPGEFFCKDCKTRFSRPSGGKGKMEKCPDCGTSVDRNATYVCPTCGYNFVTKEKGFAPVSTEEQKCPHCGSYNVAKNPDNSGDYTCINCQKKFTLATGMFGFMGESRGTIPGTGASPDDLKVNVVTVEGKVGPSKKVDISKHKINPFVRAEKKIPMIAFLSFLMIFAFLGWFPFSLLGISGPSFTFAAIFLSIFYSLLRSETEVKSDARKMLDQLVKKGDLYTYDEEAVKDRVMRESGLLWIKALFYGMIIILISLELYRIYPFAGLIALFMAYFTFPSEYKEGKIYDSILAWMKSGIGNMIGVMMFMVFIGHTVAGGLSYTMLFLVMIPIFGAVIGAFWVVLFVALPMGLDWNSTRTAIAFSLYCLALAYFTVLPRVRRYG